jgi:hypothetical protein
MQSNHLAGMWQALKPKMIPVPVSEGTEAILRQAFYAGAGAALMLHGSIQADAQRLTHTSLSALEKEVTDELDKSGG